MAKKSIMYGRVLFEDFIENYLNKEKVSPFENSCISLHRRYFKTRE